MEAASERGGENGTWELRRAEWKGSDLAPIVTALAMAS